MITARNLKIEHSEKYEHWEWVNDPRETRFTELAELLQVWWFSIKARKNFLELSANTKYGVYLIFRTKQDSEGLDAIQKASVSVGRKGLKKYVCLKPTTAMPPSIGLPIKRSDGWTELELGQFECDNATGDKDAVISIEETKDDNKKTGLIVAGIEIRPI
ncbi:F-box protein PP2-B10 [Carex littledalei]|uniref:F-box protein PP2-B10 n=1 Tax=Carex littledalei TaxID=544730 RepID=A0A833RKW4_9POAL|nr:F-box protein PP2-B10 [Carex littledalei]